MIELTQYSSIDLLSKALQARGYTVEHMVLRDGNFVCFTSPNGKSWFTSTIHITYPFATSVARPISIEKDLAYEFATNRGVRVPLTRKVVGHETLAGAEVNTLLAHAPLIVKPNDSSLSRGLTLNIESSEELMQAIDHAKIISQEVLVQEQVAGEEIRFAIINGSVVAAILRQRLRVVGDGFHTIGQLLEVENNARKLLNADIPFLTYPQITDEQVLIEPERLTLVPSNGEIVLLGKSSMLRWGASIYNVTDQVHSSYFELVQNLVKPFGNGFVVVDMLVEDYTKERTDTNYSFMEFNMAPVLNHFYSTRDRKVFDIVSVLVPMIESAVEAGDA